MMQGGELLDGEVETGRRHSSAVFASTRCSVTASVMRFSITMFFDCFCAISSSELQHLLPRENAVISSRLSSEETMPSKFFWDGRSSSLEAAVHSSPHGGSARLHAACGARRPRSALHAAAGPGLVFICGGAAGRACVSCVGLTTEAIPPSIPDPRPGLRFNAPGVVRRFFASSRGAFGRSYSSHAFFRAGAFRRAVKDEAALFVEFFRSFKQLPDLLGAQTRAPWRPRSGFWRPCIAGTRRGSCEGADRHGAAWGPFGTTCSTTS